VEPLARTTGSPVRPDERREHEPWLDWLFQRMFHLMHTIEKDNFDGDRYRNQSPSTFFVDQHAAYLSFLVRNASAFYRGRALLQDDASQSLFDQLVLFRILGHLHVRLPYNTPQNRARMDVAETWRVEDTTDGGILGRLAIFLAPGQQQEIRVKCWKENVAATFLARQYYFARDGVQISPRAGDHVVDAGGCFGDTALAFADSIGKRGHVYTFDPLPKHCEIMTEAVAMNPHLADRISIFPVGLGSAVTAATSRPIDQDRIDPGAAIVEGSVPITSLDALTAQGGIPRVDFIKMDIEGSELAALKGAAATLRRWRPRLAISLYHRPEDLFVIPTWLNELGLGYRLYLDHYSIHHEETVLYAIADAA